MPLTARVRFRQPLQVIAHDCTDDVEKARSEGISRMFVQPMTYSIRPCVKLILPNGVNGAEQSGYVPLRNAASDAQLLNNGAGLP